MKEDKTPASKRDEVENAISNFPEYTVTTENTDQLPYRALLLDDDPTYGKIVARFAEKRQIGLTICGSFDELKQKWHESHPQVAIIDYDLSDFVTGVDIARLLGDLPVILVSRKARWVPGRDSWSRNIKNFVHKKYGVPRLLDIAATFATKNAEEEQRYAS